MNQFIQHDVFMPSASSMPGAYNVSLLCMCIIIIYVCMYIHMHVHTYAILLDSFRGRCQGSYVIVVF